MIENTSNQKENDAIKIESIRNEKNRTRQTHRRSTLIFPTKVIIKSRYAIKIRAIGKKGTYQIMRKINGKVADDIVYIKDHKNKIG